MGLDDIVDRLKEKHPGKPIDEVEELADDAYEDQVEDWRKQNNEGIADARGWKRPKDGGRGWWG